MFESYYDDGKPDGGPEARRQRTRSATKTVTAMLTGAAIARGVLPGVQTPIKTYLKDRPPAADPDPRKDKVTVEDLLTMRLHRRVRRRQPVLARQRGADVPDRGLGRLLPGPAGARLPRLEPAPRGLTLWPELQLLHGRRS
ncbi:serine hydrolase [Caulobacter segnis]